MALFGLALPDGRGQVGGPDDEYVAALHPEDRHLAAALSASWRDQQDSFVAEYRIVRPDGTTLWLVGPRPGRRARERRRQPLRLISIMADVTETQQAEAAAARRARTAAPGAERRPDGRLRARHRSRCALVVARDVRPLRRQPGQRSCRRRESVIDLLHPEDRAAFVEAAREAIAEPPAVLRRIPHQAPRRQPDLDRLSRPGRIRRRRPAGADLRRRRWTSPSASAPSRSSREADRDKDNFIATLSHELRNPLAPIRNAVDVLRHLAAERRRGRPGATTSSRRQTDADGAPARRPARRLAPDAPPAARCAWSALDLAAVDRARDRDRATADRRGRARARVSTAARAVPLEGDLTRLAQVFSNVLINAAKYTPPHGRIALTATREGEQVVGDGHGHRHRHRRRAPRPDLRDVRPGRVGARRVPGRPGDRPVRWPEALVELHGGTHRRAQRGARQGQRVRDPPADRGGALPHTWREPNSRAVANRR